MTDGVSVMLYAVAEVPSKPAKVTVWRRLPRSIELIVEPPHFNGGINLTGYQVQNDIVTHQFSLGEFFPVRKFHTFGTFTSLNQPIDLMERK
jgi:hypothetical protein